ncbi:MAG: Rnase Y domain-containing protein, partial [Patescibacteria group bacterium]
MTFTLYLGAILGGIAAGTALGYGIRAFVAKNKINSAELTAEKIIKEAQIKEKDLLLQAKNKALQTIEEAKRDDENRRKELRLIQQKLEKHESNYEVRVQDLQKKQEQLFERNNQLETLRGDLQKLKEEEVKKIETVAGLTRDEAKEVLLKDVEGLVNEEFVSRMRKLERVNSDELEKKARTMLSTVIQRIASSHSVETTTTSVQIPNDEMKGRIIGKEGRNIKAIEHLTGTEIIIDYTPNAITVSGFSPIRRQVARLAIEKLIEDGRIHPTRIEECVEQAKKDLAVDIKKAGEDAFYELGIPLTGMDPKFVQILGRLKYRTSYGQNVLKHSMEVGQLAGILAAEIGADVAICKKGGLLHDVGKAVDHDVQGAHPEIGYNIM